MNIRGLLIAIALVLGAFVIATGNNGGSEYITGSWFAEIGLSPQQTRPFTSFQSTLDVGLHLDFLEISSISDFVFDGWLWQEFDLDAALGPVSFSGQLLFEPQSGSFLYAQGRMAVLIPPLTLSLYGAMVGETQSEPVNYGYVVDLYGEIIDGFFTFESAIYFGADLSGITFTATGDHTDPSVLSKTYETDPTIEPIPAYFCGADLTFTANAFTCVELSSTTSFGKTGFESEEIELSFLHLFGIPFNLVLDFTYTLQSASYTFSPSLETDYGCLSVYTNLLESGGTITALEIYGIKFTAEIGGASLTSISNLNTTDYVITTPAFGSVVEPLTEAITEGHIYYPQDYWEIVSLTVDVPPFGSGFSFSADTFFSTSTGLLFDWAQSTMGVTLALGSSIRMSSSITVDTTGFTAWKLSVRLSW